MQIKKTDIAEDGYLAVIPARGGSKRLPGKNTRLLGGAPLLAHSIKFALNAPTVDRVVVSTDSADIAQVAREHGAEVIMRPDALATDTAKTGPTIRHVLETLHAAEYFPRGVITLQPTNPLRPPQLIEDAIAIYEETSPDSVITVTQSKQKLGRIEGGNFTPTTYKVEERSQDLQPQFFENGLLYLTKPSVLLKESTVFGNDVKALEVNEPYASVDIDEEVHFYLCEQLFERFRETFTWVQSPQRI
jgi:N-acylneuraminate cytidylyltransferase